MKTGTPMVQFILEIDRMTTKEFCDKYKIPHPYFTGDVKTSADLILQVDAIKHKMFVEHAKKLIRTEVDVNERIVCAAVKYKDQIIYGYRHKNCNETLEFLGVSKEGIPGREFQGFITSTNRYVERSEAFVIAKKQNQILSISPIKDFEKCDLTSEDLY